MNNRERLIGIAEMYYNGIPTGISDEEYDNLEFQVKLEDPTFNVREHVSYSTPMISCKHIYPFINPAKTVHHAGTDLTKFIHSKDAVIVPKYDGSSIRAYYFEGKLINILSRSDECHGFNQTEKLRSKVATNPPKWVRYIDYEVLVPIESYGENARNKANGLINSKYLNEEVEREVYAAAFGCNDDGDRSYRDRMTEICGGKLPYEFKLEDIVNFSINKIMIEGKTYYCDGVGIYDDFGNTKVNQLFKFYYSESSNTSVKSIEWNRSAYGFYIPKAKLEPVMVSGKRISQVAGGSVDTLMDKGICKDAVVSVALAGLTIPYITRVISSPEIKDFTIPKCKSCNGELGYTSTGYVCEDPECSFWKTGVLRRFISNFYDSDIRNYVIQGSFYSLDSYFDELKKSETLMKLTTDLYIAMRNDLIEEGTQKSLGQVILGTITISRIASNRRIRLINKLNSINLISEITDAFKSSLSGRAFNEAKYQLPTLIELFTRLDSMVNKS